MQSLQGILVGSETNWFLAIIGIVSVFYFYNLGRRGLIYDESVWAYISDRWLKGTPPYSHGTHDVKQPLIYFLGREIFRFLPRSIISFRVLSTMGYFASIMLVYLITDIYVSDNTISLATTALYASSYFVFHHHEAVTIEILTHTFSLLGIYFLLTGNYVVAGTSFGLAAISKQTGIIPTFAAVGSLLLVGELFSAVLLAIPVIIILLIPLAYFYYIGNVMKYIDLVYLEVFKDTDFDADQYGSFTSQILNLRFLLVVVVASAAYFAIFSPTDILFLYVVAYFGVFIVYAQNSFFGHYLLDIVGPAIIGFGIVIQAYGIPLWLPVALSLLFDSYKWAIHIFLRFLTIRQKILCWITQSKIAQAPLFSRVISNYGGIDGILDYVEGYTLKEQLEIVEEIKQNVKLQTSVFSNVAIWLFLLDVESAYEYPFYGLRSSSRIDWDGENTNIYVIDENHSSISFSEYPLPDNIVTSFDKSGLIVYESTDESA
jgi:hypothetical protein